VDVTALKDGIFGKDFRRPLGCRIPDGKRHGAAMVGRIDIAFHQAGRLACLGERGKGERDGESKKCGEFHVIILLVGCPSLEPSTELKNVLDPD
jgi:hypothetical protein